MRKLTLRSIWTHKRRLISTVLSVVLGVAFLSGTFVFADTLNKVFDDLFANANEKVDARVQGEVIFSASEGGGETRARLPLDLVDQVAAVDGVAAAAPNVFTFGAGPMNRVLDAEGEPIGSSAGPPTIIENWIDDPTITPYVLTEGSRGPERDDEIALNVAAAEDGEFQIGDTLQVVTQFGIEEFVLVGTFTFGDADSAAGAVSADFTLATTQRLAGAAGQVDSISVAAEEGITQEEIVQRVADVVPGDVEVITGEAAAEQDANSIQEGLSFFRQTLSIFGTIALLVATFIIANTFQILVAQRTRELALLRAVGASRRQILGSVLLEAVVVGLVAAGLGILAGIGLAALITAALDAAGADLPSGALVLRGNTVFVGLLVGLVVTVLAAVMPAIRATRVPPLAAIREVAVDRSGSSKARIVIGVLVMLFGLLNLSAAWRAEEGDTDIVPTVGMGALLFIVGAILLGPVMARPSVHLVGAVVRRVRGLTGRLATENAARAPKRTAATASALIIGVALIGFVTVFAQSAKASVTAEVDRGITADVFVQPGGGAFGGFAGFSPEVAATVETVPGIDVVARFSAGPARITLPDGDTTDTFVGAVDPATFGEIATAKMESGSLDDLRPGTILVDRETAENNDLAIGDTITVLPTSGSALSLEVAAISDDLVVLAQWTVHLDDWTEAASQPADFQVLASVDDGADTTSVLADVEAALDPFPGLSVLDREGFIGDLSAQLSAFVNVIYGLLALSVIIAMIGVANTLSLSIHERTRELGLLRAVGMGRGQMRSTIRWEAVIIAVLGTLVGLGIGLVASYAMIKALSGFGLSEFDVPMGTLLFQVVVAAGLAVLASIFAARRAARLDILQAIAEE
jgi:putative ABC transport system permease protein